MGDMQITLIYRWGKRVHKHINSAQLILGINLRTSGVRRGPAKAPSGVGSSQGVLMTQHQRWCRPKHHMLRNGTNTVFIRWLRRVIFDSDSGRLAFHRFFQFSELYFKTGSRSYKLIQLVLENSFSIPVLQS